MQGDPSSTLSNAAWPSLAAAAAAQESKKKAVRYSVPMKPAGSAAASDGQQQSVSYAQTATSSGQHAPSDAPVSESRSVISPSYTNGVQAGPPPMYPPGLHFAPPLPLSQPMVLPQHITPQLPSNLMPSQAPLSQPQPANHHPYPHLPPLWYHQQAPAQVMSPQQPQMQAQVPQNAILHYPVQSFMPSYGSYPPTPALQSMYQGPHLNHSPPSMHVAQMTSPPIPSSPPGLSRSHSGAVGAAHHLFAPPGLECGALPVSSSSSVISMPPTTSDRTVPSEKTTLSPPTNVTTPQPPQPVIGGTSRSYSPPPPLDRYARIYVPAWLKAVNADLNYTLVPLQEASAAEEGKIDFDEYARSVWPMWLWEKMQQRGVGEAIYAAEAVDDGQELERTADAWLPAGGPGEDDALEEKGHATSDDLQLGVASTSSDNFDPTKALLSAPVPTRPKGRIYRPDDPDSHLPPALSGIAALRAHSYAEHFNPLLSAESKHREEELADSAVYSQQLHAYTRPRPGAPSTAWDQDGLYRLALPGIREERPRLIAGDRAFLRPLATQLEGEAEHGWLHIVFECRITAVRAVQGEIVLSCPLLSTYLAAYFTNVEAARFNVIFVYDERLISDATNAVDTTARRLRSRAQWWRKTLFPTLEDAPSTTVFPHDALAWRDPTLNREQRAAVSAIAIGGHCLPFLLSGPPGTGKTKTCVEAILQLVSRDPTNRILVVAPSNAASDVLALRLADHLSPGQLLRLNDPTRTFAEVPQRLSLFCYVDESKNIYSLPPWEKLMAAQVVVTATHDAALLLKSRSASNTDVGDLQLSLLPGLLKVEHARPLPHWTHLIVDEAAQGTEPDLAPALAVVAPHPQTQGDLWPSVVLVGDPAQLGPQVHNSDARNQGLDVSLLERLSRRAVYSRSLARLKKEGRGVVLGAAPSLTSSAAACHCGHLIRNYRARHPALLHLPSTLFYSDSLVPCSYPTQRSLSALRWSRLAHNSARSLADQLPLLFVDVKGHDEWVDEGVSWWNEDEARIVGECCQSLVGEGVVKAEEIAVITPFREQVWRVRLLLRRMGLGGVSVGPVEALQGQEAPVVIISPVRSRPRFLARDREQAQGIVGESKRLNVSLTRARELCIVVGNAQTLEEGCDEWRELLRHARRNGWYAGEKGESDGEKKDGETLGQLVSALESAEMGGHGWWRRMLEEGGDTLISNDDRRPPAAVEDGIGLLAGRMATVALQDDGSDHGGDGSEDGDGRS